MGTDAEQIGTDASGRLPPQCHIPRVSVELGDVVPDPSEGTRLVPEHLIASSASRRPHSQIAQSILNGHDYRILFTLKVANSKK